MTSTDLFACPIFVLANADKRRVCDQTQVQAIVAPNLEAVHATTCVRGWVEATAIPQGAKKLWRIGACQYYGKL